MTFTISGCALFGITGSGDIIETQYDYIGFTSIEAGYTCDLTVMQGDSFSIIVSCDNNIIPFLETYVNGNILTVNLQPGYSFMNIKFEATVVMPDLKYLNMSGASSADVSGFTNIGDFYTVISGASNADIDFISSADIRADISGASYINISSISTNGNIDLNCSGASTSELRDIHGANANVNISGASTGYINMNGILNGSVSGASSLYYRGTTTSNNVNVSLASRFARF